MDISRGALHVYTFGEDQLNIWNYWNISSYPAILRCKEQWMFSEITTCPLFTELFQLFQVSIRIVVKEFQKWKQAITKRRFYKENFTDMYTLLYCFIETDLIHFMSSPQCFQRIVKMYCHTSTIMQYNAAHH